MQGVYCGFFDLNIQADWVHIEHIDEYDWLYLPFPVALKPETADRLKAWVANGGTLVCEGCPAYWDDRGHVGTVQPNLGLDELFGARESYVEFTPDLLDNLMLQVDGQVVQGWLYLQTYEVTAGTPVGWYEDGRVAAVDNRFGDGLVRLVGTMLGWGYGVGGQERGFFASVLSFAGKDPHIRCSDQRVKARLHAGDDRLFLWVANPARRDLPVRLEIHSAWGPFSSCKTLWGADAAVSGQTLTLTVDARDVSVIELS